MAKYLSMEEFKKLFEEWKASKMSIREFCETIGIDENRFYYWRKKLEAEQDAAPAFVPVQMNHQNGKLSITHPDLNQNSVSNQNGSCEIVYQNGVTLRVNSAMSLQTLRSLILLCQ